MATTDKERLSSSPRKAGKVPPTELTKSPEKSRKVISDFPISLYEKTEAATQELGISRSALIRKAMREFLRRRERAKLVESIDRYFDTHSDSERELAEEFAHVDAETADALR